MKRMAALAVLIGLGMATATYAAPPANADGSSFHNPYQEERADNKNDRGHGN